MTRRFSRCFWLCWSSLSAGAVGAGGLGLAVVAVERLELGCSRALLALGERRRLVLGDVDEVGGGVHAGARARSARRAGRPPRGAGCGSSRRRQRPGPADVALAGPRREGGDRLRRRRAARPGTGSPPAAVGVASVTLRQRDRIVGSTSSMVGAHSSQTVLGVGSSIALSRVLPVRSPQPVGVLDHHHLVAPLRPGPAPSGAPARACRRCRARTSPSG